ncbi:MAG: cell division protein FtsW [Alphaproteobacteria bacterium]|nr:cell division protein FtsW [Alphaproteobacteria bacterium]
MVALSRADTSLIGRWWWTVDRWTLAAIAVLAGIGMLLTLAASPDVARRVGFDSFYFVRRQLPFLGLAVATTLFLSLATPRQVRRLALLGFIGAFIATLATLVIGVEIKGARRWIALPGMSLQPSEFLKPCFAVLTAWLLAGARQGLGWRGYAAAFGLLGAVLLVLFRQPDIGMAVVVAGVFMAQLFLSGINLGVVMIAGGVALAAAPAAYLMLPHVQSRVHRFLDPSSGDSYQITRAMEAFAMGGLFGRGPGEGRVKSILPDAHADFVFAVAGEEFGLILCLVIVALFAFVVLRGFARLLAEVDLFVMLAAAGLFTQFGLQAFINMASSLHLVPTKGMTLPFISYGGSSVFAIALGMGMALALTRRRNHAEAA